MNVSHGAQGRLKVKYCTAECSWYQLASGLENVNVLVGMCVPLIIVLVYTCIAPGLVFTFYMLEGPIGWQSYLDVTCIVQ